jgi:hypothetical protein
MKLFHYVRYKYGSLTQQEQHHSICQEHILKAKLEELFVCDFRVGTKMLPDLPSTGQSSVCF